MRRLALVLALFLTACGGQDARAPFADSRIPPALAARHHPPEGWAWGLVQVGENPPQRYGVAGTRATPKAHILLLPGYGQSAEAWFERARDLAGRGYTVWVLDGAGQGGSGRFTPFRDLGHVPSFDPDIAGTRATAEVVIRPQKDQPLILVGQGAGGLVALRAVQEGLQADGLVLSCPALDDPALRRQASTATWARRLGLGWLRAARSEGWRREGPRTVQHAWQLANPDLRMGGPSLGWVAAFLKASDAARRPAPSLPTARLGCDKTRIPWVEAVDAFSQARIKERGPALPSG